MGIESKPGTGFVTPAANTHRDFRYLCLYSERYLSVCLSHVQELFNGLVKCQKKKKIRQQSIQF